MLHHSPFFRRLNVRVSYNCSLQLSSSLPPDGRGIHSFTEYKKYLSTKFCDGSQVGNPCCKVKLSRYFALFITASTVNRTRISSLWYSFPYTRCEILFGKQLLSALVRIGNGHLNSV